MSKNLILVAGYPKTGSTWIRLMFEALTRSLDGRVAINELSDGFYGAWRRLLFDEVAPVNAADLLPEEIDDLQSGVFRQVATELSRPVLVKTHCIAHRTRSGEWLYPPDCVRSVIYLVRHPFDVAVSFAHHLGLPVEKTVEAMSLDLVMAASETQLFFPLHERIGSWTTNINSWLDGSPYPVTLIRYEDLHKNPADGFGRAAAASGLDRDRDSILRAAESINFERLRSEEQLYGFTERARSSPYFFRAGRPRSWEGKLDASLREQILRDHGATMERLGYAADGATEPLPPASSQIGGISMPDNILASSGSPR
jgi:aryl sulfotransferase